MSDAYAQIPPAVFSLTFDELGLRPDCDSSKRSKLMTAKTAFLRTQNKEQAMQAMLAAYPPPNPADNIVVDTMKKFMNYRSEPATLTRPVDPTGSASGPAPGGALVARPPGAAGGSTGSSTGSQAPAPRTLLPGAQLPGAPLAGAPIPANNAALNQLVAQLQQGGGNPAHLAILARAYQQLKQQQQQQQQQAPAGGPQQSSSQGAPPAKRARTDEGPGLSLGGRPPGLPGHPGLAQAGGAGLQGAQARPAKPGEAGDKAQGGQPGGVAANEEDVSRVGGPVAEVDALATSGIDYAAEAEALIATTGRPGGFGAVTRRLQDILPHYQEEYALNQRKVAERLVTAAKSHGLTDVDPACTSYLALAVEAHLGRLLTQMARVAVQRSAGGAGDDGSREQQDPAQQQQHQQQQRKRQGVKPEGSSPGVTLQSFQRVKPLFTRKGAGSSIPGLGAPASGGSGEAAAAAGGELLTRPLGPFAALTPPSKGKPPAAGGQQQVALVPQDLLWSLDKEPLMARHPLVWRLHAQVLRHQAQQGGGARGAAAAGSSSSSSSAQGGQGSRTRAGTQAVAVAL